MQLWRREALVLVGRPIRGSEEADKKSRPIPPPPPATLKKKCHQLFRVVTFYSDVGCRDVSAEARHGQVSDNLIQDPGSR